tara:strand:- start:202 stop:453 length:252 start_codon:yes stop_codon:yes gene_type:complete
LSRIYRFEASTNALRTIALAVDGRESLPELLNKQASKATGLGTATFQLRNTWSTSAKIPKLLGFMRYTVTQKYQQLIPHSPFI